MSEKTGSTIDHPPGEVRWSADAPMDEWVQAALDDPRVGDVFHEMYSYGVEVVTVNGDGVRWRSFSTETIAWGWELREAWTKAFRYGDHMPGKHTMMLLTRGDTTTEATP